MNSINLRLQFLVTTVAFFLNFLCGFSPKMIYGPTSDVDVYDSSEYLELSRNIIPSSFLQEINLTLSRGIPDCYTGVNKRNI